MIDLTNRVVLVTGAAGGIGAATARARMFVIFNVIFLNSKFFWFFGISYSKINHITG